MPELTKDDCKKIVAMLEDQLPSGWSVRPPRYKVKARSDTHNLTIRSTHYGVRHWYILRNSASSWAKPLAKGKRYKGRGWREKLVADVMEGIEGLDTNSGDS